MPKHCKNASCWDKLRRMIKCLLALFFIFSLILILPTPTFAAAACGMTYTSPQATSDTSTKLYIPEHTSPFLINFSGSNINPGVYYRLRIGFPNEAGPCSEYFTNWAQANNDGVTLTLNYDRGPTCNSSASLSLPRSYTATLLGTPSTSQSGNEVCSSINFQVGYPDKNSCVMAYKPDNPKINDKSCLKFANTAAGNWDIHIDNGNTVGHITIGNDGKGQAIIDPLGVSGQYRIKLIQQSAVAQQDICTNPANILSITGGSNPDPVTNPSCDEVPNPVPGNGGGGNQPACNPQPGQPNSCTSAGGTSCSAGTGVMTAIGCIPTEPQALIAAIIGFSTGIGGGIALLLMILGAFQMMTSAGNPEAIKKGRDQFVAAALGLLFIILSVSILQIIGVDILNIPGFGK